ncbi:MAG: glycosyltransferase, partial [Chitinophagaceae bacterium]
MSEKYIFCMKWGTLYGADYVNRLYSMVSRNLSYAFKMVCFTDDVSGIDPHIQTFPIPDMDLPGGIPERMWKKLSTMKENLYGLEGTALFLDLDIVIVESIDPFFEVEGDFWIIHDYLKKWRMTGNSSVYRFEIGKHGYVFDDFLKNFDTIREEHRNEQEYLTAAIASRGTVNYWPDAWCPSYKYHAVTRVPFA